MQVYNIVAPTVVRVDNIAARAEVRAQPEVCAEDVHIATQVVDTGFFGGCMLTIKKATRASFGGWQRGLSVAQ